MEALRAYLDAAVSDHLYLAVFAASVIEAAGIPFPGRIVLILAGTLAAGDAAVLAVIAAATIGALTGDHALYMAGKTRGPRLLALYCRVTLSSSDCVESTVRYFRRFGTAAVAMARFSTSLRLFAAVLAGCGHLSYGRFVVFDVVGTVVYTTLWATVGYLFGDVVIEVVDRLGGLRVILVVVPVVIAAVLAYRLWRRHRFGAVSPAAIEVAAPACAEQLDPVGGLGGPPGRP
jgi:membrane protein DedA with SNARE-associated domain